MSEQQWRVVVRGHLSAASRRTLGAAGIPIVSGHSGGHDLPNPTFESGSILVRAESEEDAIEQVHSVVRANADTGSYEAAPFDLG